MTNEVKQAVEKYVSIAKQAIESGFAYRHYLGCTSDAEVVTKEWNGKRVYINAIRRTLRGRTTNKFDLGYIDTETAEYVATRYTEMNLDEIGSELAEYLKENS